jgi:hypothetical protein
MDSRMVERLCKTCNLPLRLHSLLQLKSCESLLIAQSNFKRIIEADKEARRKLEMKLSKEPTKTKQ